MTLDALPLALDHGPDYVSDKLWREVDVFFGGVVPGFRDAVTRHPGQSLANLGISTGIGMVATVATEVSKAAMPKLLNKVVAISALISYAKDLAPSFDTTIDAFARTWHSGRDEVTDKAIIGNSIGQFLFDTSLSSIGGVGGAKFGRNRLFHEAMLTPVVKGVPVPTWAQIRRPGTLNGRLEANRETLAEALKVPGEPEAPTGSRVATLENLGKAGADQALAPKEVLEVPVPKEELQVPAPKEVLEVPAAIALERPDSATFPLIEGQVQLDKVDMAPVKTLL